MKKSSASLQSAITRVKAKSKVDLPEIKAQVTEYQALEVCCPNCLQVTRGTFPQEIRASIQFGPMVKGIALYLLYGQLLPYARTAELLTDVCDCDLSPGTLETFVVEGADHDANPGARVRAIGMGLKGGTG